MRRRSLIRATLIALDAFVGLTAVAGGVALATGVEGDRFPTSWLDATPFGSYLIPGVILAVVVGGSAVAALVTVYRDLRIGGIASIALLMAVFGILAGRAATRAAAGG